MRFYLPGLLDLELNPGPGGTKLMLYHCPIHTPQVYMGHWKSPLLREILPTDIIFGEHPIVLNRFVIENSL